MNNNSSFADRMRWRLKALEHKVQQYRLTTNETVITDTEYGKVRGVKRLTLYDVPYFSFEGIPYAQPPLGELRFRPPQRPTPWEGVRDCTQAKSAALQVHYMFNRVDGSEDCLYLNVYTNNLSPAKPRAVMVWIHGGGFIVGEANREQYGPDYFMKQDIVLVTIQYRLGVMGFLCLDSPTLNVAGNAGLKDQVMALKWIKNNCARFGGDPDCITVFGESAGAASTHYMMLTDQTQGLFHRGILQSGSAIAPWAFNEDVSKRAFRLATLAGYKKENNDKDVLEFLLNAKAKDLIRWEEKVLTPEELAKKVMFPFEPTLEPYATPECVLPKPPRELMKTAWSNSIPMLTGYTSYEGLFWTPEVKMMPQVVQNVDEPTAYIPRELLEVEPKPSAEQIQSYAKVIRNAHVTGEKADAHNYMDLCSIVYFGFPTLRLLRSRHAYAAGAPIYFYRFDFDAEELIYPYRLMRWGRGVKGVSHADELGYQFTSIFARRLPKDSPSYRTIERTVGIWTQFAMTGNPYSANINGMDTLTWDPVKKSDQSIKCLNIGDELKFIELPEWPKLKSWESLFNSHKQLLY